MLLRWCWSLCSLPLLVLVLLLGGRSALCREVRTGTWGTGGWSSGREREGAGGEGETEDIYIAGLFPMAEDVPEGEIGRGVRPAVELALQHINNDSSLLPGYTLRMIWNDSRCDMAVATRAFFDMMDDENTTKVILFGDACYSVTGPLAQISQWWNMTQISYADTNPLLSDRDKYPNFFRTVPSDTDFNAARMALLRQFNWTVVGTIFQDASKGTARFSYAHNKLITLLEQHRIDISEVTSFADDPEAAVEGLKKKDVRIILGNFDESMARRVFCSAHKRRLFGSRYQWIILGGYSHDWWRVHDPLVSCSPAELNLTIQGVMATEPLPLSSSDHVTSWGLTPQSYAAMYSAARGAAYSDFHGYTYDAVWVVAMALQRLQQLTAAERPQSPQPPHAWLHRLDSNSLAQVLNVTNYLGVTGRVQFNRGDRVGQIKVLQMQGGTMTKIGEYHADIDDLDLSAGEPIYWRGGNRPMDRNVQKQEMKRVSVAVFAGLSVLAALGIYMAVAFLAVNIMFRNHRFIKMSSPNMNNLIIVGCILCYHSVFLLGMDGAVVSPPYFHYLCGARAWILALGFTLAFGAMFSKTWRVHAIFTNIKLSRKVIKDYKLFLIVCVLVLLDAGILISWQVVDPLHRATKAQDPLVYDDYEVIPVLEYCTSKYIEIWMGSIYAYKGLLLMFGCFLAWETRHVSIPALNDSKYIGLSVYNVVIMCVCGAAVSFIIKDQPNQSFIIIALFIIFCTTITLCLVFVPKIIELRRDPKGEDKRVRATLKKPTKSNGSDDSDLQRRIKSIADENLSLRQTLSERASEVASLLEQLGEEPSAFDLGFRSAVHRKVLELRLADNSPSKLSRVSTGSEADGSTYSEVSATTTLWTTDSPPPHRPSKSKLLADRLRVEVIEMADLRGKSGPVKSTRFLETEDETDDDDPFGGVYLGPPDPKPEKSKTSDLNNVGAAGRSGYEQQPPGGVVMAGSSRGRLHSDLSSEVELDRTEALSVPSLAGLFPRVRLPRDRRHSAPVNIWTIREAVEEAEVEAITEEPAVLSRAQVHPTFREAASQTSSEELWARPALTSPCRLSPRRVTFVCDVVERI